MKIFNVKIETWYKALHVLATCAWFGAVLAVILIYIVSSDDSSNELLIQNSGLISDIDQWVIIPASVSSYIFGILLSWKTKWGFFKYKWIVFKLIIGSLLILFGVLFLGPWIWASEIALQNNRLEFVELQDKLGVSMIVQALVIAVTILISAIKPWGKIK